MILKPDLREDLDSLAHRLLDEGADYAETVVELEDGQKYRIWVRVQRVY